MFAFSRSLQTVFLVGFCCSIEAGYVKVPAEPFGVEFYSSMDVGFMVSVVCFRTVASLWGCRGAAG